MSLFCLFVILCSVMLAANTANINSIHMLNDSNFKSWLENLSIVLPVMDLDMALTVDSPLPLTNESTLNNKREMERWERSNRMCIMIMKKAIPEAFRSSIIEKQLRLNSFLHRLNKGLSRMKRLKLVHS